MFQDSARVILSVRMQEPAAPANSSRRFAFPLACVAFIVSAWLRTTNSASAFVDGHVQFRLYDDLYHAKRIFYTLGHFPSVLEFDVERGLGGAWVPWPPLWDWSAAAALRLLTESPQSAAALLAWIPPVVFAFFSAVVTFGVARRYGVAAGATALLVLASPMGLIYQSQLASIDHHFLEGPLIVLIAFAVATLLRGPTGELHDAWPARGAALLGLSLTAAMFTQTAFLLAAAIALATILLLASTRGQVLAAASSFALVAAATAIYALTRASGYPVSPWFLGAPHAAALAAAAIALAVRAATMTRFQRLPSSLIAVGSASVLLILIPSFRGAFLRGTAFIGGDPWLATIDEFQPLFRRGGSSLVDLMELAPAVLLIPLAGIARRRAETSVRVWLIFAAAFTLLTISGKRFISYALPLLAVAAAIVVGRLLQRKPRTILPLLAVALVPPILLTATLLPRQAGQVDQTGAAYLRAAAVLRQLPPGRTLTVWERGHLINFYSRQPVVIDNFGSMPDEKLFRSAIEMLLERDPQKLRDWCLRHDIRYLVLGHPLMHLDTYPRIVGRDPDTYVRFTERIDVQPLAKETVWWRLTFEDAGVNGFKTLWRDPQRVPFPDGLDAPVVTVWEIR